MDAYDFLIQGVGFAAAGIMIGSFQCRSNRVLFLCQLASALLWSLHFALMQQWTGCALNLVGVLRGAIMCVKDKAWTRHPLTLTALVSIYAAAGIVTWGGWLSLISTAGELTVTLAHWSRNGRTIRILQLFGSSPLWLIYDFCVGSIFGTICELFNIGSTLLSIFRFGWKNLDAIRE